MDPRQDKMARAAWSDSERIGIGRKAMPPRRLMVWRAQITKLEIVQRAHMAEIAYKGEESILYCRIV